ncbi:hypothetical protein [Paenibacillus spongiae]|uniref:DUF4179 domain-containing protein n=1 Tax=Paenibacillus spongiae TaxID=2909671 RepID=A0ABY5S9C2_9BACL|nr:hypothetical protein [Paenibacillus spongiae]UVI30506.1 hypothetical protein L1F29_01020 [Paenibacillus spongiae]
MDNRIKEEIDTIPIPPELHARSLLGIQQARSEHESSGRRTSNRLSRRQAIAAVIVIFLILTTAIYNTQVLAAIQKALQFVPGIGIVKESEGAADTYILKQPITRQVGEGSIAITGIMVDEKMTYVTMNGTDTARIERITFVNEQGVEYELKRSMASWSPDSWTASFWQQGQLDVKGKVKLIVTDAALEIPLTLVKADAYASYAEMGETAAVNGVTITAIAGRVDEKARISLVAQHAGDFSIMEYGIHGIHLRDGQKLNVLNAAGEKLEIENIRGISAPASDFYFPLSGAEGETYTLTLPEIGVQYKDEITVTVPTETTDGMNQAFQLAGFPVTITKTERIDDSQLRVYVDLHYNDQSEKSLYMINIGEMGHHGKLNEQTGVLEYLQFDIDPGSSKVKLTIENPDVLIRGPWKFELPAAEYFKP